MGKGTGIVVTMDCPCCGASGAHACLYRKNEIPIYKCAGCGLGRAEALNFVPETYYTEKYFEGGHSDGYSGYAASAPVLRVEFASVVTLLRQYMPSGGRLLEIGCAHGFFLEEASRCFEVHGVEISAEAVAACHDRGLSSVHEGRLREEHLDAIGDLDAIVMLDVIEHLVDPLQNLQLAVERLRPGGIVLITTGDFNSLSARLLGSRWRLMTPPQHLWYFTSESLARLGSRLGLEVAAVTHPWKIVPLALIRYQLRRLVGVPAPPQRSWLNKIGVPVNLFDSLRVILRMPQKGEIRRVATAGNAKRSS